MENVIVHPYDWATGTDAETGYTTIHCWALDKHSKPHLLRFNDFDVFCYVELPLFANNTFIQWTGYKGRLIYDVICSKLEENCPYRYMLVYREKLYFYKVDPNGKPKTYPMLLLCFHSIASMKMCKKKLSYPLKIRGLKGGNDDVFLQLKVWETDIPLVRKMLTLKDCNFSQWFTTSGIKVAEDDKISTIENEYVCDWRTINPINSEETMTWLTKPKIFSFDLETYSDRHNALPDPFCAKHVVYMVSIVIQILREPDSRKRIIILLGDCAETTMAEVIKVKNEMELIEKFEDLLCEYNPDIITGYNILGYDNPFLETRLKRRMKEWKSLGRLKDRPSTMKTMSWSSSAYKNQEFNILEMEGRISIDLLPLIKRDFKLQLYNLDFVSNHFLGRGKHPIKAKQMFETFELQACLSDDYDPNKGEIPLPFKKLYEGREEWIKKHKEYALEEMRKVVDYCVVDSDLVVDLFEKLNVWISLISLSSIMGITPMELFTRGTGVRMQSLIYNDATKKNTVLDEVDFPKLDYEGGFVFDPKEGIYNYIPIYDQKALYPSVIQAYNLDHKTFVDPKMDNIPDEKCHIIEWIEEKEEKSVHHKFKFVKEPIGIMPSLLATLVAERNKVRIKQKEFKEGTLEWSILEQQQLGVKIICNSFYGSCGSSFSSLKFPYIAAAITAKGREAAQIANSYLENKGFTVVYGDSVTGDTPLLLRITLPDGRKEIYFRPISRISDSILIWIRENEKEYCVNFGNLEIWSDKGFTKIKHVMRHKTKKRIYRVTSHTGVVKVTEDHSLLDLNANEISPNELKIGDSLLTKTLPLNIFENNKNIEIEEAWVWGFFYGDGSCGVYRSNDKEKTSWALNNLDLDFLNKAKNILEKRYPYFLFKILDTVKSSGVYKLIPKLKEEREGRKERIKDLVLEWRNLFYDPVTKYKKIPDIVWQTSYKTRSDFYDGYYAADGDKDKNGYKRFDNKGQIGAAGLFLLARSLGYKVSCNTRSDKLDIYRLTLTKNKQRKEPGIVKKIEDLGLIDDYVYDLETENHHFSCGVGELVVHNTDSSMVDIKITDPKTAWQKAEKISKELTALFPRPLECELEAIFHTMLSLGKKMYLCIYMDKNGNPIEDPNKMKVRGVTLARRDNCKFQRDFYKQTVWKVMHKVFMKDTFDFIIEKCIELVSHSVKWEDLVMIKGLGSSYKSETYMMKIFADEMEKAGNPMVAGDRIPYLVVKSEAEKMGYKMRHIDLFLDRAKSDNPEYLDYLLYLEKTIKNGIEKLFKVGYKKELEELEEKYKEIDNKKFFAALEDAISNLDRNSNMREIRIQGYRNQVRKLKDTLLDDRKVIEAIVDDEVLQKIAKPLYNYHIKRRQGRGRRLSTRVDKEPILMMVRLFQLKEEVMVELRNKYNSKINAKINQNSKDNKPKLTLKIVKK